MGGVEEAKVALGIVGNVICISMFLSPAPTFWKIFKARSTLQYSGLPYALTLFNCMLWVLYGNPMVLKGGTLILIVNAAGAAISICFLTVFLTYTNKEGRRIIGPLVATEVAATATIALILFLAIPHQPTRKLVSGTLCVLVTVAMYGAPLSVMKMVIQTKSVEYMPFLLSLFMTLNTSIWTGYGAVSKDIFVIIPNCVGLAFGICQLLLHCIYRKTDAKPDRRGIIEGGEGVGGGVGGGDLEAVPPKSTTELSNGLATTPAIF
jgi:solute carrier family 50 protein (sugar transporter)